MNELQIFQNGQFDVRATVKDGEPLFVAAKDIFVDPLGQRNVESRQAQFRKIMKTFNPLLVNPIKVGLVNGKYFCFDGQMTRKVLIAKNGGKDCMVECKVFYGLTLMEIAELFLLQNGTQSSVEQMDKLHVMANYGDPDVTKFLKCTDYNDIRIDWTKGAARNKLGAVSPQKLIRDGMISDANGYRKYAVQIFNAYNKNNSRNRLPDKL